VRNLEEKFLYVVISKTPTKFGKAIRKVGKLKYNHSAIALDKELESLYSFARKKHKVLLTGRLVKENMIRYTLNRTDTVDSVIFRIPVTEKQYDMVQNIIFDVKNDKEYIYNLISVLTYPITNGLSIYKAFSCIEFVMYVLKKIGFEISHPICSYRPDDLLSIFPEYIYFQGNLLDYKHPNNDSSDYFAPLNITDIKESAIALMQLFIRIFIDGNTVYENGI